MNIQEPIIMDYIEINPLIPGQKRRYYGILGEFRIMYNYEAIENPGGKIILIYKGIYTMPMDVSFELYVPITDIVFSSKVIMANNEYINMYFERFNTWFSGYILNTMINEKTLVTVVMTKNIDILPKGDYYLYKGKFTCYNNSFFPQPEP